MYHFKSSYYSLENQIQIPSIQFQNRNHNFIKKLRIIKKKGHIKNIVDVTLLIYIYPLISSTKERAFIACSTFWFGDILFII